MEEITEENNDVNASTKCKLSVAVDYAGPRPSAVEISFEFNSATNSIHCTQIQPENEMEDGKFSGKKLQYIVKDTTVTKYVYTILYAST